MTNWRALIPKPLRIALMISIVSALVAAPLVSTQSTAAQIGGTTHTVQAGENLFRIALRYNMTVEYLAAANGIADPSRIFVGQVLSIPADAQVSPTVPESLAANHPVPAAQPAVVAQPAAAAPVYHTVQAGETLASIGRTYGINWPDLANANGLANANQILVGQQILIPGVNAPGTSAVAPPVATVPDQTAPAPAAQPVVAPAPSGTDRTHVVQAGEHLASIAKRYGLSWPSIAAANNMTDPNKVFVGQTLIIPAADIGGGVYTQPASTTSSAASPPTVTTGKQIVVDLSDQKTYAYENGNLLRSVTVSTGLANTPTVQGDYKIYLKYDAQLMSGPGYYLPGVPWVMYFYKGYSLHGTYWHNNFGQPMSHGCVNMPTPEAAWFYQWAEMGTPVHVRW